MSELSPSLIVLDKGLDLQVPKIAAAPGTVLDSLNYEQVDFQGQKRIDGYTRYDGNLGSYIDTFYRIGFGDAPTAIVGDIITNEELPLGVVVAIDPPYVFLAIIDETNIPEIGDLIYSVNSGINVGIVISVDNMRDIGLTEQEYYDALLDYNDVLRARVESLPGPVAGLHWFRDRLYAVAAVLAIVLEGDTPIIYPNDVLTAGGDEAVVLHVEIDEDDNRVIYLNTLNVAAWYNVGTEVSRDGVPVGNVASHLELGEVASFFESRTEAQVLEEDGNVDDLGWKFNHLGWLVPFEEGISLFGSLPSLNQNIEGIGIQGPTSIAGANGRPLLLTQKVVIQGEQTQVNGWKGSDTPTSYQLNSVNVEDVDSLNVYADAFLRWDGTTGLVEAPGALSPPLTEYPATNSVVVEV